MPPAQSPATPPRRRVAEAPGSTEKQLSSEVRKEISWQEGLARRLRLDAQRDGLLLSDEVLPEKDLALRDKTIALQDSNRSSKMQLRQLAEGMVLPQPRGGVCSGAGLGTQVWAHDGLPVNAEALRRHSLHVVQDPCCHDLPSVRST